MLKVLIIEDDRNLADAVARSLITNDFNPTIAYDGDEGMKVAMNEKFDVILLDIMLPGASGLEICKTLKEQGDDTPIIITSARGAIEQRVEGLNAGADDYISKPFAPQELIARIYAVVRRSVPQAVSDSDTMRFGDLEFSDETGEISCGLESFALSEKESDLLRALMREPGEIRSKSELLEEVWGDDENTDPNNVEAYISFLRKKLSFINTNVKIKTLRKIGYRLEVGD